MLNIMNYKFVLLKIRFVEYEKKLNKAIYKLNKNKYYKL